MIADYSFYQDVFKGIAIEDQQTYEYFGERASEELAQYPTQLVTDDNALKRCACRVADILYDGYKRNAGGITSESVSGYYSVSYSQTDEAQMKKQIANAVMLYIGKYITGSTRCIRF